MTFAPVTTARLRLRPFEDRDVPVFAAYRADPEVARFQSWDAGYTLAEAQAALAHRGALALGTPGRWVQVAIADRRTDALLGDFGTHASAARPGSFEIGVTLARTSQGSGVATEALGGLLELLFGRLEAHRLVAETDDRNHAVHRLLGRAGFREEGRLVEADWFKGEWSTLRLFALLAREWRAGG